MLPGIGVGTPGADRLGRSGLVAAEDPRAMVQRRRAAGGGGARRFGIEGYASFTFGSDQGPLDFEYSINCRHLVATSVEGWASLLTYLRGFRGLGRTLKFTGPPAHPVALLVEEQRVRPAWSFQWMLRLLDVVGALEGRGYPRVSGEMVLAVEDALFPENRGPWRVVAEGGVVSVSPAGAGADRVRPISIGTLSFCTAGSCRRRRGGARVGGRGGSAWVGSAVRRAGAMDARFLLGLRAVGTCQAVRYRDRYRTALSNRYLPCCYRCRKP